jgi:hypothetical protein
MSKKISNFFPPSIGADYKTTSPITSKLLRKRLLSKEKNKKQHENT